MKKARIIVGLGYGDEGKGTMTDFLCREYDAKLVVRYNGGSQAAHNVVTDDGRHHTFSQIGSGAFVDGVQTLLSRHMLIDPISLALEAVELSPKLGEHALSKHLIDGQAPIITLFHVASNRIKEWIRSKSKHGSCGKGVGETASDLINHSDQVIYANDLPGDQTTLIRKLTLIQSRKHGEIQKLLRDNSEALSTRTSRPEIQSLIQCLGNPDEIENIATTLKSLVHEFTILKTDDEVNRLIRANSIVFEGAQGLLLDEWHGFHPYTTWSNITPRNAFKVLRAAGYPGEYEIVGITRSYSTRHGAGPFITERPEMKEIFPGEHNNANTWQDDFRVGAFDQVQFNYALECLVPFGKVDSIAITHLDVFDRGYSVPVVSEYIDPTGKNITSIHPSFDQDLTKQEQLTDMLLQSTSVVSRNKFESADDTIAHMQRLTKYKVKYLSYGQTASSKKVIA